MDFVDKPDDVEVTVTTGLVNHLTNLIQSIHLRNALKHAYF